MTLKRVILPNETLTDLLTSEALALSPKSPSNQRTYVAIAKAFCIPPKNCSVRRYILARSLASAIWNIWKPTESELNVSDFTLSAILKSAVIFELSTFLISADLEGTGLHNRNKGQRWKQDYFIRIPAKREETRKRAKSILSACNLLLTQEDLPRRLSLPLRSYRDDWQIREKEAAKNSVLIYRNDRFKRFHLQKKSRRHELILDTLIFNLVEIIRATLSADRPGYTQAKATKVVLRFINKLIDPPDLTRKGHLSEDAIKERIKVFRRKKSSLVHFESALKRL